MRFFHKIWLAALFFMVIFSSCGKSSAFVTVSFCVDMEKPRLIKEDKPDFSEFEFLFAGQMHNNPSVWIEEKTYSFDDLCNLKFNLRKGGWDFSIAAFKDDVCYFSDKIENLVLSSDGIDSICFNLMPLDENSTGHFKYIINYKNVSFVSENSVEWQLLQGDADVSDLYFKDELVESVSENDLNYYHFVLEDDLMPGKYNLRVKIVPSDENNNFFYKDFEFVIYPYGNTEGTLDGKNTDLINSFTINNAEVNEILSKFGVGDNVLIPDFYSLSEKFVLPAVNTNDIWITGWWYSFDDNPDEEFAILPDEKGIFTFNQNLDFDSNLKLRFDFVKKNLIYPSVLNFSDEFVLAVSDSKELSFIPKSDCRDFDFSKCVWKLDGIVLEIAGSDCKFIKDGSAVTVGSFNFEDNSIVLNMEKIKILSLSNQFSNKYFINLTCKAPKVNEEGNTISYSNRSYLIKMDWELAD